MGGGHQRQTVPITNTWQTSDDAGRFNDRNGHLIAEFNIPPPSRVSAFETTSFEVRETTG
jgi:hypothetical protein